MQLGSAAISRRVGRQGVRVGIGVKGEGKGKGRDQAWSRGKRKRKGKGKGNCWRTAPYLDRSCLLPLTSHLPPHYPPQPHYRPQQLTCTRPQHPNLPTPPPTRPHTPSLPPLYILNTPTPRTRRAEMQPMSMSSSIRSSREHLASPRSPGFPLRARSCII